MEERISNRKIFIETITALFAANEVPAEAAEYFAHFCEKRVPKTKPVFSKLARKVITHLQQNAVPGTAFTAKELAGSMGEEDNVRSVGSVLGSLVKHGVVTRIGDSSAYVFTETGATIDVTMRVPYKAGETA